ncbi:MAG TPA: T9SS type A sorting domain-containing protein [Flavobacteriales bacterium]|nr:T9SS type A sorting domain-containing protein [Flavobacteriales bacterium]
MRRIRLPDRDAFVSLLCVTKPRSMVTMLGGNGLDHITELDVTATGKRVYLGGATASTWGMPLNQPGTVQPWYVGANLGDRDAYYAQLTLDYTVGVDDRSERPSSTPLFVYPDPAQDWITVSLEEAGTYQLDLFSPDGQVVLGSTISGSVGRLSTAGMAAGPYLLRCSTEAGAMVGANVIILQP